MIGSFIRFSLLGPVAVGLALVPAAALGKGGDSGTKTDRGTCSRGSRVTLKVKPDAGNYRTIFVPSPQQTAVHNVTFTGITVDQNTFGNTSAAIDVGDVRTHQRIWQIFGTNLHFENMRLYVSGDTLMHEHLEEIPKRYPDIDVGLFHLGGTRIAGVLLTMDAAQGVAAVRLINPKKAIPIHYDDYTVFKSPLSEFAQAVRDAGLEDRVHYLARGETYELQVSS